MTEEQMKTPTALPFAGAHIVFVDEVGVEHDALVTAPWGLTCCNLVFVSGDTTKEDSYGRQIERRTSVAHKSIYGQVPGNFWYRK
jgi:hypothetical protein